MVGLVLRKLSVFVIAHGRYIPAEAGPAIKRLCIQIGSTGSKHKAAMTV